MASTLGQAARVAGKWWGRLFASAVVVAAMAAPARAQPGVGFVSGNTLYQYCTAKDADQSFCSGFVAGIADAAAGKQPANKDGVYGYTECLASTATVRQVTDVAVQFLTKHPELRHLGAATLVARALSEAFPCK